MNRYSIAPLVLAAMSCASRARAAETAPLDSSRADHEISLETGTGILWIHDSATREPYAPAFLFSLVPRYRISDHVSFGVPLSYAHTLDGLNVWRASGEGRLDFFRTRAFDAWGAGEVGMLFTKLVPNGCGDCGSPAPEVTTTRVAPLFGAGMGLDAAPSPFLSFGLETRAFLSIFGAKVEDENVPSSVTPGFLVALNVTIHAPLE